MRYEIGIGLLVLGLSGCANVAMTGAQTVYNHHSIQKNFKDQYISFQANKQIGDRREEFKNTNISIATFNREVLLAGEAPDPEQRKKAGELIKQIPEVRHVYNLIQIASPSAPLVRVSDTWITAKIKSKLIASNEVDAVQVKVVTENGTVYLMGILEPEQADVAVNIASHTDGVEKVVKILSYITISKHKGIA